MLLAGAACSSAETVSTSAAGAPSTPNDSLSASDIDGWQPDDELPPGWGSAVAQGAVRSMRASADDRQLVMAVAVSPKRLADGTCGTGPAVGRVTDEGNPQLIWANLSVLLPNLTFDEVQLWEGEFGACPTADSALELEIGAPLSGRDVVVNKIRWVADADGAYGVCELPDCDPETGAAPATAACEGGSLTADIRTYADVGSHASIGEKRCQDGWAMVEVDIGAGACPADEGANPCAGRRIDRLFLKVGVPHWEVLARTREAGCGPVASNPDFPKVLCEDRPAL